MVETPDIERAHRRIMDMVSAVAAKHRLPYQVHAIILDPETNERYGAFVGINYFRDRMPSPAKLTRTSLGQLRQGRTPLDVADTLLKNYPDTPLVCDHNTAQEIRSSLSWTSDDGHYRLEGRSYGILEVYSEYIMARTPKDELPSRVLSEQIFLE